MMNLLKKLYRDEEGQALAEYGLILALVAVAVILAVTELGDNLKELFKAIAAEIPTEVTT
jgi:pilus assembly protein Flp/PilA